MDEDSSQLRITRPKPEERLQNGSQLALTKKSLLHKERTVNELQRTSGKEKEKRVRTAVNEGLSQAGVSELEGRLKTERLLGQSRQQDLPTQSKENLTREQQRLLEEANQDKKKLEERVRSLEQRMEEERNSYLSIERELRLAVSAAENTLAEYQRRPSRDWIIRREEVVLSEKVLGKGAWGHVREGTFRGCEVAVKKIHELILSDYNRELFEREMSIASRCRHPNLLQFIGATNDEESPLFVTELLDTSLRHVLHQRTLNHSEIVILALDVSKGLNYLHLSTPLPIMHRDISSANVLLWRRDESWRAKLSDYGAANFLRESMTINPGALIYSAPEAFTPRQSTKVKINFCKFIYKARWNKTHNHCKIGTLRKSHIYETFYRTFLLNVIRGFRKQLLSSNRSSVVPVACNSHTNVYVTAYSQIYLLSRQLLSC